MSNHTTELEKQIAELKAQLAQSRSEISFKVGEKGGISVYGLGRFPVTLYPEQWTALLGMREQILSFAKNNSEQCLANQAKAKAGREMEKAEKAEQERLVRVAMHAKFYPKQA